MEPVIAFCAGFLAVSVGIWWGRQIGSAERKSLESQNNWLDVQNADLLEENEELVDLLDDYHHWDTDDSEGDCEEIDVELTDCEKCNGKKELCFPATCPQQFENGEYLHEAETLTSEQYDALWKGILHSAPGWPTGQQPAELVSVPSIPPQPSEQKSEVAFGAPPVTDEITTMEIPLGAAPPVTDDTVDFTESKPLPKLYGQEFKGCCQQ